ncbi:MAG: EF-P lysine aminoacylase GenX [Myxococcales bacterium]|nr:EF-P lysine aminoacylase GenX [Myxococcales bacterium]
MDPGAARPGDLVVGRAGPGGVVALEVVWRHPTGEFPAPGSDAARLAAPRRWELLRRRAELLAATRTHFRADGFLEVETPLLVPSAGTEVHLDPVRVELAEGPGEDRAVRWLITSPEHHMKRLLAAGAPAIFNVGKVFREGERGRHHRAEFTMIEWYRPFSGYEAIMDDCERWVAALAGGRREIVFRGRVLDLTPPWPRLRFYDLLRERAGLTRPEELDPEAQMAAFVDHVEPTLGHERPDFLIEWPIAMASLARPKPGDARVAERFELFAGGLELGNAFGELTDAAEQRRRCEADNAERREAGRPEMPLDEAFLAALAEGMPPSAGIAVGFDRVAMLLLDAATIDEVVAF